MTTVAEVRELVPDLPTAATLTATGDGATVRFTLPYFPVVAGSYSVRTQSTEQDANDDYTIDTATGVITFTVAPTNGHVVTVDYSHTLLSDGYYERALTRHDGNVKRAAADACDTIGRDQVLLLKVVRLLDSTMDGASVSREMRLSAKELRRQADDEEGGDGFAIVEMVPNEFAYRERLLADRLRGGL